MPIDRTRPIASIGRSAEPAAVVYGLDGADVLLVENEPAVAQAMSALLQRWGCGVTVTTSSADAMEALRERPRRPDLVIADLHLDNGENGFEVIRQIQCELNWLVPAFVVTADHSDSVSASAAMLGLEILRKPVKPAELRALMAHLLA